MSISIEICFNVGGFRVSLNPKMMDKGMKQSA
jgi:hypothetical protein